jgi:hypothetical protein
MAQCQRIKFLAHRPVSIVAHIRIAWHLAHTGRRTDTLPAVSIVLSRFCEWWALDHSTSATMLAKTPGQDRWTWEPGLRHDGGTRAGTFIVVTRAGTQTQADKPFERHMPRTLRARFWPCSRHAFSLARVWQDQARLAHALAMHVP